MDLIGKIELAQRSAGEQAVMENLRDMGLLQEPEPKKELPSPDLLVKKLYRNIKTNGLYYAFDSAINTTNAQDGETLILYMKVENKELIKDKIFCRALSEFVQKFKETV